MCLGQTQVSDRGMDAILLVDRDPATRERQRNCLFTFPDEPKRRALKSFVRPRCCRPAKVVKISPYQPLLAAPHSLISGPSPLLAKADTPTDSSYSVLLRLTRVDGHTHTAESCISGARRRTIT